MHAISHGIVFTNQHLKSFLQEVYLPHRKYWFYDVVSYFDGIYTKNIEFKAYKKNKIKLSDLISYIKNDNFILEHLSKYIQLKFGIDATSAYYDAQSLLWQSELFNPVSLLNSVIDYCRLNNIIVEHDTELDEKIKITGNQIVDLYGNDDWMHDVKIECNETEIEIKKQEAKDIFNNILNHFVPDVKRYIITKNKSGLDFEYFQYEEKIISLNEFSRLLQVKIRSLLSEYLMHKYPQCYEKIMYQTYINLETIADYIISYVRFYFNQEIY
ncbi:MAG: hypothetical protein QXF12_02740 [Candidatus Aenigmatarchaeota archaeon]